MVVLRLAAWFRRPAMVAATALAACTLGWTQILGQPAPAPAAPSPNLRSTPAAHRAAPSTPDIGDSYAQYVLGKWDELQATTNTDPEALGRALEHYQAALQKDPDSAFLASQVADMLSRIGRNPEAIQLMQSTIANHPDSQDAHKALANVYLRELSLVPQPSDSGEAQALLDKTIAQYQTLVRLAPRQPGYLVMLGKLDGAGGNAEAAEKEFRRALAIAPTNMDALSSLVRSLAQRDRLDLAQQEIAGLPPVARSGRVYATLGQAYLRHHNYNQAAAAFREAVAAAPDAPYYQNALAQALMDGGNYAQALTEFQRLELQLPGDGHAALRVAQMQLQMGQLDAAAASLDKARHLLPSGNIEVAYAGALLAQSQGDIPAAIRDLKALAARKNQPQAQSIFLTQLARLEMRTGDTAAADGELKQIEALGDPYAGQARDLAIRLYAQQHDFPRALAAAKAALASNPGSRGLHLTYANLLVGSGDPRAAEAQLQAMLHGDAGDREVYLALSHAHLTVRQWKKADQDAERADHLSVTPAQHAQALAALARVALGRQQYADAATQLRHALALDPSSPSILNALSFALAEQGVQLQQALGYAQKAVASDGDNGAYLDSLGWVYFKLDQLPKAIANLKAAARAEAHDSIILDHLAQAYARSGEWREAESVWSQAEANLKLNPSEVSALPQLRDRIEGGLAQSRRELGK